MTGMGIGLIFWGVAEPTAFFTNWFGTPLNAEPFTETGRELALGAAVFTGISHAPNSLWHGITFIADNCLQQRLTTINAICICNFG